MDVCQVAHDPKVVGSNPTPGHHLSKRGAPSVELGVLFAAAVRLVQPQERRDVVLRPFEDTGCVVLVG